MNKSASSLYAASTVDHALGELVDANHPPVGVRREVSRGLLALTDQLVVSGTNFVTMILIARNCEMAEVGVFFLAWTVVGFLRTAQERLLSNPYLVFVHRPGRDEPAYLGSSLFFQGCFAVACALFTIAIAGFVSWRGQPVGMSAVLFGFAFSITPLLLRDHIRSVCSSHFKFGTALGIDVFICFVQLAGISMLAWLGQLTVTRVALLMGLACLLPTVYWVVTKSQPFRFESSQLASDWTESWQYSRWLVAARTIGIGGYFLVPWLVVYFLDAQAAAPFATCSGLVGLSLTFIMGANNFFQPRTVKAYHDAGLGAMVGSLLVTMVMFACVLSLISTFFYFFGGELLSLIYGTAYAPFGNIVFLLSLSTLSVCVSIACGNGLAALGKPRGYFWGELSYCVVAIATAIAMIPRWELAGAATSIILGGLAASFVTSATLLAIVAKEQRHP